MFDKKTLVPTVLFAGLSLPQVYGKTNSLLKADGECPTYKTKLLHTLVFFVLCYLAYTQMNDDDKRTKKEMVKCCLCGALTFFLLSSTEMYRLTSSVVGALAEDGCPTLMGVGAHSVVFALLTSWMMKLSA